MGMFDTYAGVQLKVGPRILRNWKVGDKVEETEDGVYFGHEGCVVIKDSILIGKYDKIHNKWGKSMDAKDFFAIVMKSPSAFEVLYGAPK